jgi:hypothetical protein
MNVATQRSIVIAYEDQYCDKLHLLIKALRRDRGQPGLCLEARSVHGTGGFAKEVPRILRTLLKQTRRPPDRVVCLADADRPQNLTRDAPPIPGVGGRAALDAWVVALEAAWHKALLRDAPLQADAAAKLTVVCLRWSKESLLAASPEALLAYAEEQQRREQVTALLKRCEPCPTGVDDSDFVTTFRRPNECMDQVVREIAGRKYKKGRDDEDILARHIKPSDARRAEVLRRCPDLERLLAALA